MNADTQSAMKITKSSDNSAESSDNSITSTDEYEKVYLLTVGLGRIIRFKDCDLREPPSITFASNIPRLDRVWDDERPSWDPQDCGKNLLSINGTPIALRYWRDVFSGKKSNVWASLKKLWSEWKVGFHFFQPFVLLIHLCISMLLSDIVVVVLMSSGRSSHSMTADVFTGRLSLTSYVIFEASASNNWLIKLRRSMVQILRGSLLTTKEKCLLIDRQSLAATLICWQTVQNNHFYFLSMTLSHM
ncbi:hypothetical protein HHX47_DHR5000771 [Lentinula edodes]|nr:hypothetical protein HHX47_DHR5000771 [Lentinula edodes]